jgi:opacity protein-like surface antigen
MKHTIAALAFIATTVSAMATDVPSRAEPVAPKAPVSVSDKDFYVGFNAGALVTDGLNKNAPYSVGVVAGYKVFGFGPVGMTAEGAYDYDKNKNNTISGNVIGSYKIGAFTPYALAGVGYRYYDARVIKDEAIWNVGGGVKYAITSSIDADARYRRIEGFDSKNTEDRATIGMNYKF